MSQTLPILSVLDGLFSLREITGLLGLPVSHAKIFLGGFLAIKTPQPIPYEP